MALYIFFIAIALIAAAVISCWNMITKRKPTASTLEKIIASLIPIAFAVFIAVLRLHSSSHDFAIDPFVDNCYSPIAYDNAVLHILIHICSLFSLFILYFREYKLPPLLISVGLLAITLGILMNLQFLYHISSHDTSRIHLWEYGDNAGILLALYPIILTLASIHVLFKMIENKAKINYEVRYKDKWLNTMNSYLAATDDMPTLSILLAIPFLLLVVVILVLFGQDLNSLYTETATWQMSQHIHPPTVDDKHGHYLCTVAALGSANLVKPTGIGFRNNGPIIINRQLQVANAFEFMIEQISPMGHKWIRTNYDKHGLNLARRINSEIYSNLTYILMKPLEYIFLIALYTYYIDPEKIIQKQYRI